MGENLKTPVLYKNISDSVVKTRVFTHLLFSRVARSLTTCASGPKGSPWWCLDCLAAATPACEDSHAVMKQKAALGRRLREVQEAVPQLTRDVQDVLKELGERCPDQQVPATLTLLTAPVSTCDMTLTLQDGVAFTTSWQQATGDIPEDALRAIFLLLAKHSRPPKVSRTGTRV